MITDNENNESRKNLRKHPKKVEKISELKKNFESFSEMKIKKGPYQLKEDELTEIVVLSADDLKRKRNYCLFCEKACTQIIRHFKISHSKEKEVKEFLEVKKSSSKEEYLRKLQILKFRGNYNHNMKVIQENRGYFVVSRRPSEKSVKHTDFVSCPFCFIFVLSLNEQSVRKYKKNCHYRPPNYKDKSFSKKKGTFPAEIIKAMLENAEFKRLHEQRKKPRKGHFQQLLVNTPPLPDGYTWYNLMEKFSGIMNGKY